MSKGFNDFMLYIEKKDGAMNACNRMPNITVFKANYEFGESYDIVKILREELGDSVSVWIDEYHIYYESITPEQSISRWSHTKSNVSPRDFITTRSILELTMKTYSLENIKGRGSEGIRFGDFSLYRYI